MKRRIAAAALLSAAVITPGCKLSGEITDPTGARAEAAHTGGTIGALIAGPGGAGIGEALGYLAGTAALMFGAHARGKTIGARNGTTATPHAATARI